MVWFSGECEVIPLCVNVPWVQINIHCELPPFVYEPHHNSRGETMLNSALEQIRDGASLALLHRRHGLRIDIHDFKMHPVDFNPYRFFHHTYYYVRKQLDALNGK
jgi:hypothetical protein